MTDSKFSAPAIAGFVMVAGIGAVFAVMSQSAKTESTYETKEQLDAIRLVPILQTEINGLKTRMISYEARLSAQQKTIDEMLLELKDYPTNERLQSSLDGLRSDMELVGETNNTRFAAIDKAFEDGRSRELRLVNERVTPRLEQDEKDLREMRTIIFNHINSPTASHHEINND